MNVYFVIKNVSYYQKLNLTKRHAMVLDIKSIEYERAHTLNS